MKKTLHLFLALIIAVSGFTAFGAETPEIEYGVQVTIDGTAVSFPDQKPLILDGRTLVPVRGVFEALGAEVRYLEATDAVQILYQEIQIDFPIGSSVIQVTADGKTTEKTLDTAAILMADRTMVPLRFTAETIGAQVEWDEENRTVVITTAPPALPDIEMGEIQLENRVSAGRNNLAVIQSDGTVWVQGRGNEGQLGGLSESDSLVPIAGIDKVIAVSCGKNTIYALRSDGTVWSWGSNASGALGTGITADTSKTPAQITGLSEITAISAGESFALALDRQGRVYAWGSNRRGQLGTGDTENRPAPVQIDSLKNVTAISAGIDHSAAVMNGSAYTWGSNAYRQLGGPKSASFRTTPYQVSAVTRITDVKAGGTFTLALRTDGSIYQWGTAYVGPQGEGDEKDIADEQGYLLLETPHKLQYIYQEYEDSPYLARTLTGTQMLVCGDMHAGALKDGTLYAWGDSALFRPREDSQLFRLHAYPMNGTYSIGESPGYRAVYAGRERTLYLLDSQDQLWRLDGGGKTLVTQF